MTKENNNDSILANAVNKRAEALAYTGLTFKILQVELMRATLKNFPVKTILYSPEDVVPFINSWQPDPDLVINHQKDTIREYRNKIFAAMMESVNKDIENYKITDIIE